MLIVMFKLYVPAGVCFVMLSTFVFTLSKYSIITSLLSTKLLYFIVGLFGACKYVQPVIANSSNTTVACLISKSKYVFSVSPFDQT